jgi:uncharacterized damage-inducible protein DinB
MTATKEHLQAMFEYVRWADQQMLAASRTVPDEGYFKEQHISLGSIHKLLVHCMAAQWIWLSRWRGESRRLPDARCAHAALAPGAFGDYGFSGRAIAQIAGA